MSKCIGCIFKGEAAPVFTQVALHVPNPVTKQLQRVGIVEQVEHTRLACVCGTSPKGRCHTVKRDNEWLSPLCDAPIVEDMEVLACIDSRSMRELPTEHFELA